MSLIRVSNEESLFDVLATRYRAAFDKTKAGRKQWIEGTLELAQVIADAKKQPELASTHDYRRWLERNGLEEISPQNRSALNNFAKDLDYARDLLEASTSTAWQKIWRDRPNKPAQTRKGPNAAPSTNRKGRIREGRSQHNASGSSKRRRNRIPDVMQEANPTLPPPAAAPPPPSLPRLTPPARPAVVLQGLTREQVDPDFKGTPLEFAAKYGHVTLHTKDEIEHHKQQELLSAGLGAFADAERPIRHLAYALGAIDPAVFQQWLAKPGKAVRFELWCKAIEMVSNRLGELKGKLA